MTNSREQNSINNKRHTYNELLYIIFVILFAVSIITIPATARPPPDPLCSICTDQLVQSADDHGVEITVGERHQTPIRSDGPVLNNSRLAGQIFENKSSRWVVRVSIDPKAASTLRSNDSLRRAIVTDAFNWPAGGSPDGIRSTIKDNTLIVTFRVNNVAHYAGDTLVFDAFQSDEPNRDPLLYGGGETVVLSGPKGYRVVNQSIGDKAIPRSNAVVWKSHENTTGWYSPRIAFSNIEFVPTNASRDSDQSEPVLGSESLQSVGILLFVFVLLLGSVGVLLMRGR